MTLNSDRSTMTTVLITFGTTQLKIVWQNFDLLLLHSDELRPPKQTDNIHLHTQQHPYFMRQLLYLTPRLYFVSREGRC